MGQFLDLNQYTGPKYCFFNKSTHLNGGRVEFGFVLVFMLIVDCIVCTRGRILITALAF